MKNYLLIILISLITSSCTLNKVVKHHGVHYLEKKQKKLQLNLSNKNDVTKILGSPSINSMFDNDVWIYIERKTTVSNISSLGRKKLLINNVLILEFDKRGILLKKDFKDKNQMNEIKFAKNETGIVNKKEGFIYNVLLNLRQKINDPLGKRKAR